MSNVTQAYCPAKAIARAETYNTEELISLPQIAVADSSLIFFDLL